MEQHTIHYTPIEQAQMTMKHMSLIALKGKGGVLVIPEDFVKLELTQQENGAINLDIVSLLTHETLASSGLLPTGEYYCFGYSHHVFHHAICITLDEEYV